MYYLQFFENEKCEQKVEINLRLSSYSTPKMVKIYNLELIIFSLIKSYRRTEKERAYTLNALTSKNVTSKKFIAFKWLYLSTNRRANASKLNWPFAYQNTMFFPTNDNVPSNYLKKNYKWRSTTRFPFIFVLFLIRQNGKHCFVFQFASSVFENAHGKKWFDPKKQKSCYILRVMDSFTHFSLRMMTLCMHFIFEKNVRLHISLLIFNNLSKTDVA